MDSRPGFNRRATPDDRRFLDAICLWRGLYARRGPQDRSSAVGVDDAIASAELRLHLRRVRDERLLRRFTTATTPRPPTPGWPH